MKTSRWLGPRTLHGPGFMIATIIINAKTLLRTISIIKRFP